MRTIGHGWRMLGLLVLLLTACGTPNQGTGGEQAVATPGLAADPATATPESLEATIPQALPTATRNLPSPTTQMMRTPGATSVRFSLAKTLTVAPASGPHYLADWSANGSAILYTQLGEKPDSAEVYVLDVKTGKQWLLTDDSFAGLQGTTGFHVDIAPPQWTDDGSQVLISKPKPGDQQELVLVDLEGKENKTLGLYTRGPIFRQPTGDVIVAQKGGFIVSTKVDHPLAMPDLDSMQVLTSIKVNTHNKAAYLSELETVRIIDVADPNKAKNINARMLVGDTLAAADRLEVNGIRWSPDGQKLAFWVHYGLYDDIWVTDAEGNTPQRVASYESIHGGSFAWSPDNTMIATTIAPTGTEAWKYINLSVIYLSDLHQERIAERASGNPLWDKTGTLLAIAQYDEAYTGVNTIALYQANK